MAFKLSYHYNKQQKEIGFSNDKFRSVYDAIAKAEDIDLDKFHSLENQLANVSRDDRKTMKDFREGYFRKLGITQVTITREEM